MASRMFQPCNIGILLSVSLIISISSQLACQHIIGSNSLLYPEYSLNEKKTRLNLFRVDLNG
jgi:hypothetical protein